MSVPRSCAKHTAKTKVKKKILPFFFQLKKGDVSLSGEKIWFKEFSYDWMTAFKLNKLAFFKWVMRLIIEKSPFIENCLKSFSRQQRHSLILKLYILYLCKRHYS